MKASNENLARHRAAASRLRQLLSGRLLEGSLYEVASGGTTLHRLTDKSGGRWRSLHIPKANVEEVREWTRNWKEAKALLKEISECARDCLREQSPRSCAGRKAAAPQGRTPRGPSAT